METLPPKTPLKPAIKIDTVLRKQTDWKNLWFYQKTVVLYRMTYVFTRRYFPTYGDRTVDQMVQAARSGKQNIVEGSEGKICFETYEKGTIFFVYFKKKQ